MSTKRLPVLIAAVLAGLLGLQMVFVAIQAQSAERDEKVVHALLRTHQILINPMFMSNALLDLSSAGFMKCVKLIRRDNQQAFFDSTFQSDCGTSEVLLEGAARSVHLKAANGVDWVVQYTSQNSQAFHWAVWLIRALAVLMIVLAERRFRTYQAEQEFRRNLEKMRSEQIATASAQTAHDLGSPFSLLRILSERAGLSADEKAMFHSALNRSGQIVEKLKAQVQNRHGNSSDRFDLLGLVTLLAEEKSLEHQIPVAVARSNSDSLPAIQGDATEVSRMLSNLINNAVDADAKRVDIIVDSHNPQEYKLKVKDDGRGMSKSLLDRILSQPFSTKATGSGLGVSHARRYMRASGGQFEIESLPPHGTTVILTFRNNILSQAAGILNHR